MIADQAFFQSAPDGMYVCYTPVSFPMNYFIHTYIVTVMGGEINRFDMYREGDGARSDGYVYKNLLPPWEGCHVFYKHSAHTPGRLFDCKVLCSFTIDRFPKIYDTIERLEGLYSHFPNKYDYHYLGTNSNTYTKWLLKELDLDCPLPWRAWG